MKRSVLMATGTCLLLALFFFSLWSSGRAFLYAPFHLIQELFSYDPDDETLSLDQAKPGKEDDVAMAMVEAGRFWAGLDDSERGWNRRNIHIDAFMIDVHEVTNAQYKHFIEALDYPEPPFWEDKRYNRPDNPVVGVNWYDARAYCWWTYKRLPTEAEWEKAARGTAGHLFPWGDEFRPALANLLGDDDGHKGLAPVGTFPGGKSPYGASDMVGNVWEWCRDWYSPHYYREKAQDNPLGPRSGHYRVVRGGSWVSSPQFAAFSSRDRLDPHARGVHFGFRCARSVD
jgi:formylglycine-generating enzyme required for sulfatase activity